RTLSHGLTGWGAFQRKSPTGGAAKGTPRKAWTPALSAGDPSMKPESILVFAGKDGSPMRGSMSEASVDANLDFSRYDGAMGGEVLGEASSRHANVTRGFRTEIPPAVPVK